MSAMPPPPPFILRLLGSDDVELMEEMLTVFGEAFDEAGTFNDARPSPAYPARLLGSGRFFALADMKDGAVAGGLAAYELPKFETKRRETYIYDLAVAEPHLRYGLETAPIQDPRKIGAERAIGRAS